MARSFAPFGDWHDFVAGLTPRVAWQSGLTLPGVLISCAARARRGRRAAALTLTPSLVGGTVNTLAGLLNPAGLILALISAAPATFGGTVCLFRAGFWAGRAPGRAQGAPLARGRSPIWLALGALAPVVYFFVLGPGIMVERRRPDRRGTRGRDGRCWRWADGRYPPSSCGTPPRHSGRCGRWEA